MRSRFRTLSDDVKNTGWISFAAAGSFSSSGSPGWSQVNLALADDGGGALSVSVATAVSGYLIAQALATTGVPDTAEILGIAAKYNKYAAIGAGDYTDETIQLMVAGTAAGSNLSAEEASVTSTSNYDIYGGIGNTWGLTLTGADINGSGFGVRFQATATAASRPLSVDHVAMRFWYR